MTPGRLKDLISCLTFLFILTGFHLAAAAQATSDLGAVRSNNGAAVEPLATDGSTRAGDAIAAVNVRIKSEGYDRVWQMTGPFGGDVTALSINPRNADQILLGTSDGQIYRSTDGGLIWKRVRPGISANGFSVTVILFDREKAGTIYVGVKAVTALGEQTKGGSLYYSEDSGETWREFDGMHGRGVRGLVQSAKDGNLLVLAALDGIYRSVDRGQNWERITPANDPELRGFHSVALDPRDVSIIYIGTNHLPWKTVDGGQTWKRAGSKETGMIDDSDIFAIQIDESNPDTVLMSACSGIYRSLDASSQWSKIQGIPYTSRRTHVIYQHPIRPEVIFAGTTEGLWLSTSSGKPDSWRRVTSLRLVINAIAIHPDHPDRIFLGTEDNGILISNDGGESYETSNAGFINRQVQTVLADRKERGRVYAGVIFDGANSGLFISEDGGLTWQQSMNGMGVRDVYSLFQPPSQPETVYAGTNHGLFRSDDHGRNWTPVKKYDPLSPGEDEKKTDPSGANSPDGSSRPAAQPSATPSRPRRIGGSARGASVELISKTRVKPGSPKARSQAKKKTGAASTRRAKPKVRRPVAPPPKPLPSPASDLVDLQSQVFALASFTPIRESSTTSSEDGQSTQSTTWMLASTWDGLFRTEDEKKGWKEIKLRPSTDGNPAPKQPRINAIATTPLAPGMIMVGTEEGLYLSRDNGETFNLTMLDDEVRRVRVIVFDPRTAENIYVGSSTGFFRSTDGGRTWEQRGGGMPLLTDITAISLNDLNPDEIYVGDDMRGNFYHSKDRGKNWERLDISQLPSTKIRSLAGDPFDQYRLYVGSFSGGVYVMSRK